MSTIAEMVAKLSMDSANFSAGLATAMAQLEGAQKQTSTFNKVAGGAMKSFGITAAAGLGTFATVATGVVASTVGVGIALGNMAKDAAGVEGLTRAFDNLAEQAGTTGDEMLAAMKKGSGGTVSATQLMTSFNMASSLVSAEFAKGLPEAMDLVSKASVATGQDMGFLMDSLVKGVGRVSPMILDNLGVQVSLTEATEKYAESVGKSADALTKSEQQAAVNAMVMDKLREKYGEMESVYDTSGAKLQQMQAQFADMKTELGVAFMPVLVSVMETVMEFADDIMYPLTGIVQALVPAFTALVTAISPLLGVIGDFAQGMGEILDAFLNEDPARAVDAFSEEIGLFAQNLTTVLPELITFGVNMIMNIVTGIAQSIPALMTAGVTIIQSILPIIIEQLPLMMALGVEILLNIINGIAEALPMLIEAAALIIVGLATKFIELIPQLIETGLNILMALVEGILLALPILVASIPTIITTLVSTVVSQLPVILTAGLEILMALIEGIMTALPQLISAIPEIIVTIVEVLVNNLPQIITTAILIIVTLAMGIVAAIPQLIAVIPQIITAIVDAFKNGTISFTGIGQSIVDGIKSGLSDSWNTLVDWVTTAIGNLVDSVKNLFGIQSPSKVFAEIGENLNKGLALGIKATVSLPEKELRYDWGIFETTDPVINQNNYNLTMPTSNSPTELGMAFEIMKAVNV